MLLLFLILLSCNWWLMLVKGDCSTHLRYKQDEPSVGMHVLCAYPSDKTPGIIVVKGLEHGYREFYMSHHGDAGDVQPLLKELFDMLGTSNNRRLSNWGIFTTQGTPIYSIDSLLYHRTAVIHTNGLWIWPGVRIGFQQTTFEGTNLTTLSVRPLVHRVHNFLSYEECDLIQSLSLPHMENSKTSKMDKDVDKPDSTWRTSTQYFLPSSSHENISAIDYRVAALTNSRIHQQEWVQVLRYEKTQQYKHHTDYFDINQYQTDKSVLRMLKGGEQNRLITVFWYLSDVEKGGHTIFPLSNGAKGSGNTGDCDVPGALKVQPIKGEAIIFYSLLSDGSPDKKSLHGGCPVIEGTKWSANKWIWLQSKDLY